MTYAFILALSASATRRSNCSVVIDGAALVLVSVTI